MPSAIPALCLPALLCAALLPGPAAAACGGAFGTFLKDFAAEAVAAGHSPDSVAQFLHGAAQDPKVLKADRAQGVFRLDFLQFSQRVISGDRLRRGAQMSARHDALFDRIARDYGVPRGVLLAFWALETDYGAVQGDFNTRDALLTLAHDCRRPGLFRPQAMAALTLFERGDFDPARTTGAWAGEIGQVQMLPADILRNGTDGDGDGHVRLKTSAPDALTSGAAMLRALGWRAGEPWLQEVSLPAEEIDWRQSGLETRRAGRDWSAMGLRARTGAIAADLPASLLLPMGRHGPAFLAYPNFSVLFDWNRSFVYVTTAAYFATRLEGAPVYDAGRPDPGLSAQEMTDLQRRLAARGHDVGAIDGILGERTRAAVQAEQARLGLPADAWPTAALLSRLR